MESALARCTKDQLMKLKSISEQVAVILGASSGIGRETALRFADRGAKVVVAARGERALTSLVDEITTRGGEAISVVCDVADVAQVEAVAGAAVRRFGRIDTWVNAAAVAVYAPFEETTVEEFRRIFEVNVMGQVHGAKAALPRLREAGGGSIIGISSVEAVVSIPLHSAYAASKHAVDGMLDALRRELLAEGAPISVTSIKPASINTPFFNNARTKIGVKPQGPPPVYQPSVVADCVLYAAENPVRDLYAGGAAKMLATSQMLTPGDVDETLSRVGMLAQRTREPRSADAPNNLYAPLNDARVEGDFSDQAVAFSPYTWLETNPLARTVATAVILGGATWLLSKGERNDRRAPTPTPGPYPTSPPFPTHYPQRQNTIDAAMHPAPSGATPAPTTQESGDQPAPDVVVVDAIDEFTIQ
jgi:NAD(P)-dependent dehydrogenase (short-subunit alcohol dehydrogenase family)